MDNFDVIDFVEEIASYDYDYIADDVSIHELDDAVNSITSAVDDSSDIVSSLYDKARDSDFY